jgi:predicted Holliday junction resolvase-like endonuclease
MTEWVFIVILVVLLVVLLLKDRKRHEEVTALAQELAQTQVQDQLQQARKEAVEKSNQIVKGKVLEHFSPYFPTFPYNPQDARFLGSPIDFVVFDGLSEGNLKQIVFVEVKSGTQDRKLPKREQQVKDCVMQGKVHWIYVQHPVLPAQEQENLLAPMTTTKSFWQQLKSIFTS